MINANRASPLLKVSSGVRNCSWTLHFYCLHSYTHASGGAGVCVKKSWRSHFHNSQQVVCHKITVFLFLFNVLSLFKRLCILDKKGCVVSVTFYPCTPLVCVVAPTLVHGYVCRMGFISQGISKSLKYPCIFNTNQTIVVYLLLAVNALFT